MSCSYKKNGEINDGDTCMLVEENPNIFKMSEKKVRICKIITGITTVLTAIAGTIGLILYFTLPSPREPSVQGPPARVQIVNRDCELGEWSNWTEPSGVGIIERVRLVKVKELGNGTCPALRETKTINRDCELGEWSNWTEPIIERVKLVKVKELGNGTCSVLRETETVNRDCELGEWSNWSEAFGFETIERRRLVKVKELGNGTCRVVRETKERPITINSTSEHFGDLFVRPPTEPRDLLLIIDGSGSIGSRPFAKVLEDLSELIGMFCPLNDPLDPIENPNDHIKLSVILFSTTSDIEFNFNKHQNVTNAQQAIRQIAFPSGGTCTDKALTMGTTLFTIANGMRPETRVKKEVLLLTDGIYGCASESKVVAASDALKQVADIYGIMIGISREVGRQKLSKLVSMPLKDHLFAVTDIGQFSQLIIYLKNLIDDGKLQCAPFQEPLP